MKEKKIGVSKIVINIGDKEAALTVEQAKELRDALNAVLGERVVERVVEHDRWYPYQPYVYPRYFEVTVCDSPNISGTITNGIVYANGNYTITLNNSDDDLLPA
jgi:hypothetical protein